MGPDGGTAPCQSAQSECRGRRHPATRRRVSTCSSRGRWPSGLRVRTGTYAHAVRELNDRVGHGDLVVRRAVREHHHDQLLLLDCAVKVLRQQNLHTRRASVLRGHPPPMPAEQKKEYLQDHGEVGSAARRRELLPQMLDLRALLRRAIYCPACAHLLCCDSGALVEALAKEPQVHGLALPRDAARNEGLTWRPSHPPRRRRKIWQQCSHTWQHSRAHCHRV